jgi:hypothetical protein
MTIVILALIAILLMNVLIASRIIRMIMIMRELVIGLLSVFASLLFIPFILLN